MFLVGVCAFEAVFAASLAMRDTEVPEWQRDAIKSFAKTREFLSRKLFCFGQNKKIPNFDRDTVDNSTVIAELQRGENVYDVDNIELGGSFHESLRSGSPRAASPRLLSADAISFRAASFRSPSARTSESVRRNVLGLDDDDNRGGQVGTDLIADDAMPLTGVAVHPSTTNAILWHEKAKFVDMLSHIIIPVAFIVLMVHYFGQVQ